ncbi:spore photoproduct lyase [Candidatus Magnetomoraceae bacterium gMMP-1]
MIAEFSKVYIDQAIQTYPQTRAIVKQLLRIPYKIVNDAKEVYDAVSSSYDPVQKGKEVLFLTSNKGAFIRKCPGTKEYICCGYQILHIGTFCTMDCSYCILQSYFHPPVVQFFVNHDKLFADLKSTFLKKDSEIRRIGTGEFTDSMIWEKYSDLTKNLILKFADQDHAVLELKSKTTNIKKLKNLKHNRKTILAWSLNTPAIIKTEERSTTTLKARLRAAEKCQSWGYPIAFHFDPLILYDGCEEEYKKVVREIFTYVSPDNIVWISIGTFRFMPLLKPIIQKRFIDSKIVYGEFIPGLDGKMRYFKPLRIQLYQKMISWIKEFAPDLTVYFCMEDEDVWYKSTGFIPKDKGGLPNMLDESAVKHCGIRS